jgi:hypothetical protein
MPINAVTNFRQDWYDTPAGPKQMYCACNPYVPCLYHFYVLQNGGHKPRLEYQHGQGVPAPETAQKRSPGKQQRPQTSSGSKAGTRPGKPSKKPQKTH